MRFNRFIGIWMILLLGLTCTVFALNESLEDKVDDSVEVVLFYGDGCRHCHNLMEFLDSVEQKYNLNVVEYEVYNSQNNREAALLFAKAYGEEFEGVPMLFVGDEVFAGFSSRIETSIISKFESIDSESYVSPFKIVREYEIRVENQKSNNDEKEEVEKKESYAQEITLSAVILGAIVDAINPCAFAVLILLLTTILNANNKRRVLFCGLAFSLAIFISYFFMGLGLYSALVVVGISDKIYFVIALLAIILGLFNLKDYFWYGKYFVMEVPLKWRPYLKRVLASVKSPAGAFFVGFLVSLFLLPCTSGPYIIVISMLSKSVFNIQALFYLGLYNLIFVLPMILITLGVYFGFANILKLEKRRNKNLRNMHLIAGLILLVLGLIMLVSIMFNWI